MADPQQSTQFLTLEDSAAVDRALLATHEKFLARLTISSLNLLKHIAQEGDTAIENLSIQQIIEWFERDAKLKREQGVDAAFLKW
ncbi:MAG TPA: hypothetical protein V6D03_06425 [Candidatus Caenarcaniphilales bacterium]